TKMPAMHRYGPGIGVLPEDIVIMVLRSAARPEAPANLRWKQQLPLLAVCRQWRRIALPLVARALYIVYGNQSDILRPLSAAPICDADCAGPLSSNMDLLGSDGYAGVKMDLRVRVFFGSNPLPALDAILGAMRRARAQWANIRSLTVNMTAQIHRLRSALPDACAPRRQTTRIARRLAELLPGVRKLQIDGPYRNEFTSPFYGRLAHMFSHQLTEMVCLPPIPATSISFSSQLTCLEIGPGPGAGHTIPRAVAGTLMSLTLYSLHPSYGWGSFADGTGAGQQPIVFASLKRLWLFYSHDGGGSKSGEGTASRLEFPALEMLHYCNECSSTEFLDVAQLPARMDSVRIRATHSTFQRLCEMGLPRVDDLSLSVLQQPQQEGKCTAVVLFRTLSQLIAQTKPRHGAEILVDDKEVLLDPTHIACPQLSRLRVTAPASAETLLAVIVRFPHLQALTFTNLAPPQVPAEIPVAALAAGDAVGLPPFATRLEALYIEFRPRLYPAEVALAVAQYVMLRTPSLRRVLLRNLPGKMFEAFFQQYRAAYPHLETICML
ncbi:hypothetical protein H4R19_001407, partial [Coemansia spiralis]